MSHSRGPKYSQVLRTTRRLGCRKRLSEHHVRKNREDGREITSAIAAYMYKVMGSIHTERNLRFPKLVPTRDPNEIKQYFPCGHFK